MTPAAPPTPKLEIKVLNDTTQPSNANVDADDDRE